MLSARTIRFTILLTTVLSLFAHSQDAYSQNSIGWIEVKSTPSSTGAEIYIDGNFTAMVPAKFKTSPGKHTISIKREYYETLEEILNVKSDQCVSVTADLKKNAKVIKLTTIDNAEIWVDGQFMGLGNYTNLISFGEHTFETRIDGHRGYKETITITPSSVDTISLPAPQPIMGSLSIKSNVTASVKIDGKDVGTTPLMLDSNIQVGNHLLAVTAKNYTTEEFFIEIVEGTCSTLTIELSEIVDVDFRSKPSPSLLSINGEIVGSTPFPTKLKAGKYDIAVYNKNHIPARKSINVSSKNNIFEFKLKRQFLKPSAFYISGEYQLLGLQGIKGSVGGFIKNINIEANLVYSLKESEVIYWNNHNEMTEPSGYTYKPLYSGGRLGYCFIIGTRLRITPQVGTGILMLKGTKVANGASDPKATDGYCIPGIAGARIDFAIAPSVAICLTPNYSFSIVESKLYSQLSPASKAIHGYANGVSVSAGLCFFF